MNSQERKNTQECQGTPWIEISQNFLEDVLVVDGWISHHIS